MSTPPIPALVTAATLDPATRQVVFHLEATPLGGAPIALLLAFSLPTREEVEAMAEEAPADGVEEGLEPLTATEEEEERAELAHLCPGCGCAPGDGRTDGCTHPDGCGYLDGPFAETPTFYGEPGKGKTYDPAEHGRETGLGWVSDPPPERQGLRTFASALRALAEYLEPLELAPALREALFLEEVIQDYGPAGKEKVLDRLLSDVQEFTGRDDDGELVPPEELFTVADRPSQLALVLTSIMGGESPREALATQGLLDG
jgi:hypothetical protein